MGVLLDQAPPEVHQLAADILTAHHPELRMPDGSFVTLSIMMAYRDDNSADPPLKDDCYRVVGKISVIAYKQRVDHRRDAEILLDQRAFDGMPENRQRALLDHLITALEFVVDDVGAVKTDDVGRPRVRVRPCDWFLKGFRSVAQRYGEDALEVAAARAFQKSYGDVVLEKEEAALFSRA